MLCNSITRISKSSYRSLSTVPWSSWSVNNDNTYIIKNLVNGEWKETIDTMNIINPLDKNKHDIVQQVR